MPPKSITTDQAFSALSLITPPANLDAERSVIGSILLSNEVIDDVAEIVQPEHFYSPANAAIFRAATALWDSNIPFDPVTLAERLQHDGALEDVGGVPAILEILDTVPHAGNAVHYAGIVRHRWTQRTLIQTCTETLRDAINRPADTIEIVESTVDRLHNTLESASNRRGSDNLEDILLNAIKQIGVEGIKGVPTGFEDLDAAIGGLYPGQLIILAARPKTGKSAFVTNLALYCAETGYPVLINSLEMSHLEIAVRLISRVSYVPFITIQRGSPTEAERQQIMTASEQLSRLPIEIDDTAHQRFKYIAAKVRRATQRRGVKVVIVDYLQLIEPEDRRVNREQQIAQLTRGLKQLAKACHVPIICLSQLNRDVEKRDNKKPRLSDLRESGAIEQDADSVWALWRPDELEPTVELCILAQRNGPNETVKFHWDGPTMSFGRHVSESAPSEHAMNWP